ncbi:MAG: response regulator [Nitrospinota bacterium]
MDRKKTQILLVEDDDTDIESVQRAFREYSEEYNIIVSSNLFDAKAKITEISPDIVITDLFLPDGSGIELLPTEKNDLVHPFILLTGKGDEEKAVNAIKGVR